MKHLELQIKDFGQQFTEQVKCFESKVVVDSSILSNILDLYKRRAAIEQDYSDNLLKLSSSITQRNNLENLKRPKWKNYSPVKVLNSLLASTEHTARAHKNLCDIYGKQMTQRVMDMQDDCARLTKKSIEILQRRQAEIVQSVNQLLIKQKNYIKLFNDADDCRRKADKAMEQLDREVIRCQDKKRELEKNIKIKKLKDEYMEKFKVFKDKHIESTTTRNKYIIHLVSLKDAIDHFYTNELHTIIQCAQYGFHNNLTRLSMNHGSCEEALDTVHSSISKLFSTTIDHIDATNDMNVFFDTHKSIFTLKEQLHYSPAKDDNINKIIKTEQKVENDLKNMHVKFDAELKNLAKHLIERKSKIDGLSISYNELINQTDYDVVDYVCPRFQGDQSIKDKSTTLSRESVCDNLYSSIQRKIRESKLKKEIEYFKAMEEYLNDKINMINITTKLKNVETVLSSLTDECESQSYQKAMNIQQQTAVIIGMKTKLFGGDLKKYSWETKELVPLVVRSCIRLINLYGMRNIGVFRVPGSQIDVQTYKTQFELGFNPIRDLCGNANDVNSAASLLKLYFRELDPPIFDEAMFNKIVEKYSEVKQKEDEIVEFMKEIVSTLDPAVYATVTYLVSFVSHLAEFSNDNCMDILNLAIIFGPCLMPIPEDQNCQLFQCQAIVNHVAQCLITYRNEIFTREAEGPIYVRNQSVTNIDESTNLEPNSAVYSEKSAFFDESLTSSIEDETKDRADKLVFKIKREGPDYKNLKRNESTRNIRSRPLETQFRIRRNSDSERNKNLTAVAIANYTAKIDQEVSFSTGDSILLKKKINEQWWSGCVTKAADPTSPPTNGIIPNAYISIVPLGMTTLKPLADFSSSFFLTEKIIEIGSKKENHNKSHIEKDETSKKISLVSVDSDNDLEFSSQNCTSRNLSVENIPDLSDTSELKSMDSGEIIADIDSTEDPVVVNESPKVKENEESKVDIEAVKIRTCSLVRSPETLETMDIFDDDLRQTMQGLQRIEQLSVSKHRSTIHIDKNLLASKFISPLRPEPLLFLSKDTLMKNCITEEKQDNDSHSLDYKIKKPGNVSVLASSFEMSQGPRVIQPKLYDSLNKNRKLSTDKNPMSTPPPTFPKPNLNKK